MSKFPWEYENEPSNESLIDNNLFLIDSTNT